VRGKKKPTARLSICHVLKGLKMADTAREAEKKQNQRTLKPAAPLRTVSNGATPSPPQSQKYHPALPKKVQASTTSKEKKGKRNGSRPGQNLFTGLASDKVLFKARPPPVRHEDEAPVVLHRWKGRASLQVFTQTDFNRVLYKPPLNGVLITSEDERHVIGKLLLNSPPLKVLSVSMNRVLDILAGEDVKPLHVRGLPHVTKSEHYQKDVIFAQGSPAAPGVFFVCEGRVSLFRKGSKALMDRMQHKLFLVGAFPGMEDESKALRKPKSSEKQWELASLGPGDFMGLSLLPGERYVETARADRFVKLVFIPGEVLGDRLKDVRASIKQAVEASVLSRERQFERLQALFEGRQSEDPESQEEKDGKEAEKAMRFSLNMKAKNIHEKGIAFSNAVNKIVVPVIKGEGEKRYFTNSIGGVAFAAQYNFKPGQVPQINPEIIAAPTDRTSFNFLKTKKTFGRPRAPGSGPDLRLPPACERACTRVDKLYQRLWNECTPEVWDALLTAQLVDESNIPIVRAPLASVEGIPSSPLHDLKVVPTIDLNRISRMAEGYRERAHTARPVTAPNRARYSFSHVQGERTYLEPSDVRTTLVIHRRPMTSRPSGSAANISRKGPHGSTPFNLLPYQGSISVARWGTTGAAG